MSITHHLDEATLISYAAGALSQAMALVVACHISVCPSCRARVKEAEAMGGGLLEQIEDAAVSEQALDEVLARIATQPVVAVSPVTEKPRERETGEIVLPVPLADYLPLPYAQIRWKKIIPGMEYIDLPLQTGRGGVAKLMRIAPGRALLPHRHEGNELIQVIQGSFSDETGHYQAGDIADNDPDIEHCQRVEGNELCVCLVATDAPLRFSTWLGKLVQPVTGF